MTQNFIPLIDKKIMPYVSFESFENRYPAHNSISFSPDIYKEMRFASENLFNIFLKTLNVFRKCSNTFFDNMDIPLNLRQYLNIPNTLNMPSNIARFDFVLNKKNEIKMVELNADTPCAIVESYYGNKIANDYLNKKDPNNGYYSDLKKMFMDIFISNKFLIPDGSIICFSCFHDYVEDYGNTIFLMNAAKEAMIELNYSFDIRFVSFYDIGVDENGIVLPDNEYARFLYRLHPMEILIDEKSHDNKRNIGEELLDLVKNGKIIMMNPAESIIIQNKGFQALVWSLMEEGSFYTKEEEIIIKKYMIPSYFNNNSLKYKKEYIKKPIWGREGNNMEIFSKDNHVIESKVLEDFLKDDIVERECDKFLYQEFIDSNLVSATTDEGELNGFLTLSCFILNGKPSSVYSRFSVDKIAGIEAYWLPLSEK